MEFIDLKSQYLRLKEKIDYNIKNVLESGQYIMGYEVQELEQQLKNYVNTKYCVTCANGTEALLMVLMAWDIKRGDAVFVPSFTFAATAEVVSLCGATPVFVDIDKDTFNIDSESLKEAISKVECEKVLKPKAIIPVDLFGQPYDYIKINEIAHKHNLLVLEDGAQGFGGIINSKKSCALADAGTTSFFPAKPLGCYGDGGAIFTDDDELYEKLVSIRMHGKGKGKYDNVRLGMNSRLDTIQAAILQVKFDAFIKSELVLRQNWADKYSSYLKSIVEVPKLKEGISSSWAQYTILLKDKVERDSLQKYLKEEGIPSMIYYPIPLHLQKLYEKSNTYGVKLKNSEYVSERCLSIPMHAYLNEKQIIYICEKIDEFFHK